MSPEQRGGGCLSWAGRPAESGPGSGDLGVQECRGNTGGVRMQHCPCWAVGAEANLGSGERMKSLGQENGLIKVHLMLGLQISPKLGRYHE